MFSPEPASQLRVVELTPQAKFREPKAVSTRSPGYCSTVDPAPQREGLRTRARERNPQRTLARAFSQRPPNAAFSSQLSSSSLSPMNQATLLFAAGVYWGNRSWEISNLLKGMEALTDGSLGWAKRLSLCVCFNFVPQKTNQYVYPLLSGARVYTGESMITYDPEPFIYT